MLCTALPKSTGRAPTVVIWPRDRADHPSDRSHELRWVLTLLHGDQIVAADWRVTRLVELLLGRAPDGKACVAEAVDAGRDAEH